ncbi:alpha/beta-Hydrolases superfamily protein [Striga asiatica]|uniref:Alpha/beta-Hydrolases superfamily protein n=1 Tax=Striga asiatica TaxID=4170 RepID=A0A5A7P4X1_STRAF|nr:alpha/beta-Hydrolases superfamily protein [Striga asiatica]
MPGPSPTQKRPALPWKTRCSIFLLNAITDFSSRPNGTVNRSAFRLIDSAGFKVPPNPKPRRGVTTSDVSVDPSRNLWFRLFTPAGPPEKSGSGSGQNRLPVVVFFHGGGFVYLAPDFKGYDHVCRRFAREVPAVVVSVNYRLAPEHRFPAQYDDGFDVLRFLDDRADVLPPIAEVSRCFLAGDSAGGNLAHHVLGVVAIQPFLGGEARTKSEMELDGIDPIVSMSRTDWVWNAFMAPGPGIDRDHEAINISGPKAVDMSKLNFPATMVVVAGFDSLKDRQTNYYEWLRKSGKEAYLVEYPNMIHAFYVFPEIPETTHLISSTKHFIDDQCSKLVN